MQSHTYKLFFVQNQSAASNEVPRPSLGWQGASPGWNATTGWNAGAQDDTLTSGWPRWWCTSSFRASVRTSAMFVMHFWFRTTKTLLWYTYAMFVRHICDICFACDVCEIYMSSMWCLWDIYVMHVICLLFVLLEGSKQIKLVVYGHFAECLSPDTRQSDQFWHS